MSGLGISILSEHTLTCLGSEGLARSQVTQPHIEPTWYLVRLRPHHLSPIAGVLLDYRQRKRRSSLTST